MKAVKIGTQTWSRKNLEVDHYRNGDVIPEVQDADEWANLTTGAWCYYKNKKTKKYGKLYNWYAVNDPRGLAPEGWHISTKEEFKTLKSTVKDGGNSLKAKGVGEKEGAGTNATGFSALLPGYRYYNGNFNNSDNYTCYWSSTVYDKAKAYNLGLYYDNDNIYLHNYNKRCGFSIRLIKDI